MPLINAESAEATEAYSVSSVYFSISVILAPCHPRRRYATLAYTLPDPTGTPLVMTKANGNEVGHVLYDGYGAVLTSTLPATLTTTLAGSGDVPDPDTGLVYLGDGRWYDPALGRPLQPNPISGPLAIPQSLNRYAATPLGQPGVMEAAASEANLFAIASQDTILQTAIGYGAGKAIETTAWGSLSITASQYGWRKMGEVRSLFQRGAKNLELGKTFRTYSTLGRVRDLGKGQYLAETGEVIDVAELPASARIRFIPRFSPLVRNALGGGAAFGISAIFQGVEDWNNPYLTSEQFWWRVSISGAGGVAAWYASSVLVPVYLGGSLGAWAGPVGIVVGAAMTFVWMVWVQPVVFDVLNLNPERQLKPLP
jgi:hypothetical protein